MNKMKEKYLLFKNWVISYFFYVVEYMGMKYLYRYKNRSF